jgi:hypothetical protein
MDPAYNPATREEEIRIAVQDHARKNIEHNPILKNQPGIVLHVCNRRHTGGIGRRFTI